jgi:hypothetical protein
MSLLISMACSIYWCLLWQRSHIVILFEIRTFRPSWILLNLYIFQCVTITLICPHVILHDDIFRRQFQLLLLVLQVSCRTAVISSLNGTRVIFPSSSRNATFFPGDKPNAFRSFDGIVTCPFVVTVDVSSLIEGITQNKCIRSDNCSISQYRTKLFH